MRIVVVTVGALIVLALVESESLPEVIGLKSSILAIVIIITP
jgi:hypothetical protein